MNKIERAIYDLKLLLAYFKQEKTTLSAKIEVLQEQLNALQNIEKDKSIPHSTPVNTLPPDNSRCIKGGGTTTTFNPANLTTFTSSNPTTP